MLNKIIQYSLHNRMVVMIASIALLLWGSYTAHKMEVDVFPRHKEWLPKKWSVW